MRDYLLKSGTFQYTKEGKSRVGGLSLFQAFREYLAASGTCCDKNIAANAVTATSVVSNDITSTGGLIVGFIPAVAQDNITAGTGGAISVATYLTTINTDAGGDAFTLADGVKGQMKKILLVVDGGGNATITPANLAGGTTITMNDAADYVVLIFNGTDWVVIENSGSTVA